MKTSRITLRKFRFEQFVDRYLNDDEYRQEFDKDRIKAVERMGYDITPKIRKALTDLDIDMLRALAIAMAGRACC